MALFWLAHVSLWSLITWLTCLFPLTSNLRLRVRVPMPQLQINVQYKVYTRTELLTPAPSLAPPPCVSARERWFFGNQNNWNWNSTNFWNTEARNCCIANLFYVLLSIVFAFRFKKTNLPILSHSPNRRSKLWTWVKSWPRLSIGVAVHRCRLIVPNRRGVGLYSQCTLNSCPRWVTSAGAGSKWFTPALTTHPLTQLSQGVALDLLSLFIVLTRISQAKVES